MASLYPERIASYFASMSPLSAKIIADIQCVEEAVKLDSGLSYNEKSKIIDKHLIYDVIRRHKQRLRTKEEAEQDEDVPVSEIYYDDPELDQDHVSALLTSVYPKRPEKYVYDDNSFYVDEHSEPFSYCSQSQAQYCDLEKLVKALPQPPTLARKSDAKSRSGSHHHHHHHHRREKKPVPLPPPHRLSTEVITDEPKQRPNSNETVIVKSEKKPKKSGIAAFGVPLMGLSAAPNPKSSEKKYCAPESTAQGPPSPESNLPNKIPKADLIAELQAKLKMNKEKGNGNGLKRTSSKVMCLIMIACVTFKIMKRLKTDPFCS